MILSFGTSEGTVSAILSVGTSVDLGEIGDVMMSGYDVKMGCLSPTGGVDVSSFFSFV